MSVFNWQLYDDYLSVAKQFGLEVKSKDGGFIKMVLPPELDKKFWCDLITPANKMAWCLRDEWQDSLEKMRNNITDFHVDFSAKHVVGPDFFSDIIQGNHCDVSRQQLVDCVERILDTDNFDKYMMVAQLRIESD